MAEWILPFDDKCITCAHGVVDKLHPNGHRGTDYGKNGVKLGTKIPALTDAKVVISEWHHNLGNVTVLKLPTGKYAYFCHLQEPGLAKDTLVKTGDIIGKVGNTGAYSFGAHLHCGISDQAKGFISGHVESLPAYVKKQQKASKPAAAPVAPAAVVEASVSEVSAEPAKVEPVAEAPAKVAPEKKPELKGTLQKGSDGDAVYYLQKFFGMKPGKFGPKTHDAVVKLQKDNGLKADGVVGPLTWKLVK